MKKTNEEILTEAGVGIKAKVKREYLSRYMNEARQAERKEVIKQFGEEHAKRMEETKKNAIPRTPLIRKLRNQLWWYEQAIDTANGIIDYQKDELAKKNTEISRLRKGINFLLERCASMHEHAECGTKYGRYPADCDRCQFEKLLGGEK